MGFVRRSCRRRAFSLVAAFALLSMLAIGPRGALALIQQIGDSPSPATGHAEVIAQGVASLPDDSSTWNVIQANAASLDSGAPANYGLGFTVATDGGILVNDYTAGLQRRLSNGEAAFSESGAYQQHASLPGSDTAYLRIVLGDESSGNSVYTGDAFTSPDGLRDIDLLRDVLGEGEATTVNAGSAPSLVYVVSGEVVIDDGSNTTTLQAGGGLTVDGEFDIESQANGSIVLVAVIGNDVPAPPRISGTVTLDIRACPAGVTAEQLQTEVAAGSTDTLESCTAVADPAKAGLAIDLNPADDDALPLKDADLTDEDGVVTWEALPFGDYNLGDIAAYPDGYGDSVMSDGNLNLGDHSTITLSRDNPDIYRVIYLLPSATADGSIEISYRSCRVANFDDFDPEACTTYVGEVETQIFVNGSDEPLRVEDSEPTDSGSWVWGDLTVAANEEPAATDPGAYIIGFGPESDDTTQIVVDGAEYDENTGNYRVNLTPDQPAATVTFYSVNLDSNLGRFYLQGVACPDPEVSIDECGGAYLQLPGVTITTDSGESFDTSAAIDANPEWLWDDLPFEETYTISASNIVPPDGYVVREIVNATTGESGDSITISNSFDAPTSYISVYLDPITDDPGTPADSDADGLYDDEEASYGADPANPDTDTDCFMDGSEVAAGTDPADPGSFPEGDCDI